MAGAGSGPGRSARTSTLQRHPGEDPENQSRERLRQGKPAAGTQAHPMNVTVHGRTRHYRTVTFDAAKNAVLLIEQRRLPHEFKIVGTRDYRATAAAIKDMVVRGAGAIGATAAYGLAQGALAFRGNGARKFSAH